VHLHVLGSSGTYPVAGRPASGYLLQQGSTRVWLDCGPGTYDALCRTLDPSLVTAVVISHQHADHVTDLFAAFHAFAYGPRPRVGIPVIAPPAVIDRIVAFDDPDGPEDALYRTFAFDPVADGVRRRIGDLDVTFVATDHSVPTLGSRWTDGARTFGYTADTGPSGDWHRLADGVDLLLCEATYQGEADAHPYPHHLTAADAGRIARERGAARLMLTHVPPHLDVSVSVAEAEVAFDRPVAAAVPGTEHKV
jgi:ribonuclease BN (tRNA processing enzyme)